VDPLRLDPIGVIRSPYATPLDAPRQGEFASAEARVELLPRYAEGLRGVEADARLLVVWWAHLADRATLSRPGSDGVFGMRTPHRPNPICLSEVVVVRVEPSALVVRNLEATDGTPVLDIKSASAEYEGWSTLPRSVG
jgi:tRNA-Thr(GGU) m(6)t(6)A37 methyltransferase TsaA